MSLSWKVLPSWLLQLKGLRLKDDRIYTAQDKHFSSDISCRNYKLCTAVLYFLDQKSPQLPHAPPAASPSLLSCQGWSPDPALQLQDHKDVIPGQDASLPRRKLMVVLNIWSIPTRQGWDLQHLENRSPESTAQLPSNPRPASADLGEAYCSISAGKLGQDWEK